MDQIGIIFKRRGLIGVSFLGAAKVKKKRNTSFLTSFHSHSFILPMYIYLYLYTFGVCSLHLLLSLGVHTSEVPTDGCAQATEAQAFLTPSIMRPWRKTHKEHSMCIRIRILDMRLESPLHVTLICFLASRMKTPQ